MDRLLSIDHLNALIDRLWALAVTFVPRLIIAIVIVLAAMFLARKAARGLSAVMARAGHIDATLRFVVSEIIRYAIIVLALIAALEQVGIKATSLFAVLGAAGLAIGLALQGTLSNIAAGVMLLWLRPFRIGDYIEVNNVPGLGGTVRQMGLFTCQLDAYDGLYLFVPNAALWNVPLRNFTRNPNRLIAWQLTLPSSIDPQTAENALRKVAESDSRILKDPPPIAFVDKITGDSHLLDFRIWTEPRYVGGLQRELPDRLRQAVTAGIEQPPAVQLARIIPPDADPSRLADTGVPAAPRAAPHHRSFR
jgi:small conductance mechanosensitive channel